MLINRAAEQFYGISRTEVMGRSSHDLFPADTSKQVVIHDESARPMFLLSIIEEVGAHKAAA